MRRMERHVDTLQRYCGRATLESDGTGQPLGFGNTPRDDAETFLRLGVFCHLPRNGWAIGRFGNVVESDIQGMEVFQLYTRG